MARYTYVAKPQPDKTLRGFIEAESEAEAVNKLTAMGYIPVSVAYETQLLDRAGVMRLRRISRRDIVQFTRQLATLVDSGVNILNALQIIANQSTNRYLTVVLQDVAGRIRDGQALSESLSAFPTLFPAVYCAMIRTGEASGNLHETLKRLADFLEQGEEFAGGVRASLMYPAFVLGVSVVTVTILLVFVVPRLVTMFEDMGQALPLPTQILIGFSALMRNYWWLIAAGIALLVFTARRFYASPRGRQVVDRTVVSLAVVGPLALKAEIARLMRALSLLQESGVPITPALETAGSLVNNRLLRQELVRIRERISAGDTLSSCLRASKLFPEFVVNIVAIGEETGQLGRALGKIAVDYEKDVDRALKNVMRLTEPVIILVMGLIVGFIVIAMLLPIFQMNLIVR